jgi:hypothetical protein
MVAAFMRVIYLFFRNPDDAGGSCGGEGPAISRVFCRSSWFSGISCKFMGIPLVSWYL